MAKPEYFVAPMNKHPNFFVHLRFLQLKSSRFQSLWANSFTGNVVREGTKEDMDWDKEATPGPLPRPRFPLMYHPDGLTAAMFNSTKMR